MTNELFEILVDSLKLPINGFYEWLIMAIVGVIAYRLAYTKTGKMIRTGHISRKQGSDVHWALRFIYYFAMWVILRIAICIYRFVVANKGVSIFAAGCIVALITTIMIFKNIEDNKRV